MSLLTTHLVAPSILSADFGNLQQEIEMVNESNADWIHFDVMDGLFVPNISFGMPILSTVKKIAKKPLDVHLMIVNPERYIETFKKCGADILTVHYEACTHLHSTIHAIKAHGMKAGVALNPHTSINLLEDILPDLDLILIMSVNPGFGGQQFIENTIKKIKNLKKMIHNRQVSTLIEVDGGVDFTNAKNLVNMGTDVLVAGNTIFKSKDKIKTISDLKNLYSL